MIHISKIQKELDLSPAFALKSINMLAGKKYITLERPKENKRIKIVKLTEKGRYVTLKLSCVNGNVLPLNVPARILIYLYNNETVGQLARKSEKGGLK